MEYAIGSLVILAVLWFMSGIFKQRRLLQDPAVLSLSAMMSAYGLEDGSERLTPVGQEISAIFKEIPQKERLRVGNAAFAIARQHLDGFQQMRVVSLINDLGAGIRA